eukprot:4916340-Amphidinium_carterae.1
MLMPAKKERTQLALAECEPGMTNLSIQANVAFIRFPHTSQAGVAKIVVELYDESLAFHGGEPMKLTVMGEENVTATVRLKFDAVVEMDGVSCTDYQSTTSIVREDVALSLRPPSEGDPPEVPFCSMQHGFVPFTLGDKLWLLLPLQDC